MPPFGRRFNRDFFMNEVLDHFDDRTAQTKTKKWSIVTFVQIHLTQAKLDSLEIHRSNDPSYCLDIAPCVFWLFGSITVDG
jgi:hypothetical protein